ncbi:polysaccharide deacetylase family protein [Mobilicoccus massiliensis]|uniref:polysaccharide deacetylase family protein n=1 Tax=Mobilicoccus massiliensis TaxID=1522310 RepID=UPI0009E27FD9|nr:polysaccharide deacetylase family protein [Mobilicoccus massiliensis]
MPSVRSIAALTLGVLAAGVIASGPFGWWSTALDAQAYSIPTPSELLGTAPAAPTPSAPVPPAETWTVRAEPQAVPSSSASTTTAPTANPVATPSASPTTAAGTRAASDSGAPLPSSSKVVYLTIDDGPDPRYTPQVLRILDAYGAKATFFMVGQEAARHPALLRRVRAAGHAIGNHTYTHPWLAELPEAQARAEVDRTNRVLGGEVRCLRAPGGLEGGPVKKIAHEFDLALTDWTVDTSDWRRPGTNAIVTSALGAPAGGGAAPKVVLMHDGGGDRSQSVAALPAILQKLGDAGYTFEALPTCS